MSLVRVLRDRGEHAEVRRIVAESVVRNRGDVVAVSHDLGLDYQGAYRYLHAYCLWDLVRGARARATAPPRWLLRTLSVIEGGVMNTIEQLYQASEGMTVEEIAAEIESSIHAGMVDSMQLAEALAAGTAPEG